MTNDLTYNCFSRIDTYVNVAVYGFSQHADLESGKWVMDDAKYRNYRLENIYSFREATDKDKKEYLLHNSIVPTEYCMMDGYDEWEKKRISVMVVGNAEDLNKRLNEVRNEVLEKEHKLYEFFKI